MAKTNGHIAKFVVLPGCREQALEILRPMFAQVEEEPGTLLYAMHASRSEANVILFYERYADDAAFDLHSKSEAHDLALERIIPLLDPSWRIYWVDLVWGKGLRTPRA